jgi:hypothetical protein
MKLTKRAIDSFKYEGDGKSRDARWDDQIPGFGVRIYPSGKKAFILSYWASQRKRLITLGSYGIITLDQARDKAKCLIGRVVEGEDPVKERKRVAQGKTVQALCEAYIERYARPHKRSWKDDQSRINKRVLPIWGKMKVSSISRSDVAVWHHRIGEKHPYEANRNLALVSKMFNLAKQWGFLEETAINPAYGIVACPS